MVRLLHEAKRKDIDARKTRTKVSELPEFEDEDSFEEDEEFDLFEDEEDFE